VIPAPAPTSDRSRWTDGPGRFRVELDVNGAKLRGWDYKSEASAIAQAEVARSGPAEAAEPPRPAREGSGVVTSTSAAGAAADRHVPVVVFFNGNLMTIERSDQLYRRLAGLGVEVVVYDYRGYGFSEGQPTSAASGRTLSPSTTRWGGNTRAGGFWSTASRSARRWPRTSPPNVR